MGLMEHSELRQAIVAEARTWIGTPFQHQGRMKGVGVDCIGLIFMTAQSLNLAGTAELAKDKRYIGYSRLPKRGQMRKLCDDYLVSVSYKDMQPADVLLMKFGRHEGHIALYAGDNQIIHALSHYNKCTEHSMNPSVRKDITGIYRFPVLWS